MADDKVGHKAKSGKAVRRSGILAAKALAVPTIEQVMEELAERQRQTKTLSIRAAQLLEGYRAQQARRRNEDPESLADEFNRLEGTPLGREEKAIAVLVEAGLLTPEEGARLALQHMRSRSGE